jgi:hypothetical protein
MEATREELKEALRWLAQEKQRLIEEHDRVTQEFDLFKRELDKQEAISKDGRSLSAVGPNGS